MNYNYPIKNKSSTASSVFLSSLYILFFCFIISYIIKNDIVIKKNKNFSKSTLQTFNLKNIENKKKINKQASTPFLSKKEQQVIIQNTNDKGVRKIESSNDFDGDGNNSFSNFIEVTYNDTNKKKNNIIIDKEKIKERGIVKIFNASEEREIKNPTIPSCKTYIDDEKYFYAKMCLQNIIDKNPNDILALFYLALTYHKQKYYMHSTLVYKRILKLKPDFQIARLNLVLNLMKQRNFHEAEKNLLLLIEKDSKNWKFYYYLSRLHTEENKLGIALKDITQALKLNSQEILLYQLRGEIYFRKKNYKLCILDFETYLKKSKNSKSSFLVLISLAKAYKEIGATLNAIDAYAKAIKIFPMQSDIYFELGLLYSQDGNKISKAIEYFEISLRNERINPKACLALMSLYPISKIPKSFITILQENLDSLPFEKDYYEFYIEAANFYLKQKNIEEALATLRKAIDTSPEDKVAYLKMIEIFQTEKKVRNVELVYEELLENNPSDAQAHYELGMLYQNIVKHYKKAKYHFQKYVSLQPNGKNKAQVELILNTLQEN